MAKNANSRPGTFHKTNSHGKGNQGAVKSKSNAASGYARRQSVKDKKRSQSIGDLYEYEQDAAPRRSKIRLELDKEEEQEFGGLDDMGEAQRDNLRARLIGENEDDEKVASEDDEEIDSDAAFEESDEERYAEFFPGKTKKSSKKQKDRAVRFVDVDLNEDDDATVPPQEDSEPESSEEEEEESGDNDEFIDLLGVLDGKGEIDMPSDNEPTTGESPKPPPARMDQSSDVEMEQEDEEVGEEGDEESSEDEDIRITASDDEDGLAAGNPDNLQHFVESLDTKSQKRKADDEGQPVQKRKRRMIREVTETGAEDEFRVTTSGDIKLILDDFLGPLSGQSSALQTLKKATKILGSSSKAKTLAAPLPQRAQEKLDREAAYEQTKEEVDKWNNTMRRIREAEHLSFPLQAERPGRVSNLELTAKFKPSTALESAVDSLLKSAKVREEELAETEEGILKANNLSVEEVAERRAELRKMRELMYRAEVKAKRVKKIKSKTYRKIKRKERERITDKLHGEDGSDDEDEEARMKRETERARERATLRHKHTGKWARQMRQGHMNEDQRKEIEEMLDKGEKLRRRVQGVGSDDSGEGEGSSDEDDEDEDLDPEEAMKRIKAATFDELQQLKEGGSPDGETFGKRGKSIFEMKFMKNAMARQNAAANREADDFLNELGGMEVDEDVAHGLDTERDPSSGVVVQRVGGRTTYRPGAVPTTKDTQRVPASQAPPPPSDTSSVTLKSNDLHSPAPFSPMIETSARPFADSSNPWLAHSSALDGYSKLARKNEVVVNKDSKSADKSKNKLKKEQRKREEIREKAKDDAMLEISMDNVLQLDQAAEQPQELPNSARAHKNKAAASKPSAARSDDDDDDDTSNEIDAQEQEALRKTKGKSKAGPMAFQQRDLVAQAFAGDNVVREFQDAKRREIADDAPKEIDTTLMGWGSWGGAGTNKYKHKRPPRPDLVKKVAGVDPTKRADYNKANIIISEKRDKKAAKYLVKDLPYPYTSQMQFERAMERPIGAQWNTRMAFQRGTLPRVVKKPGAIIAPLTKAT